MDDAALLEAFEQCRLPKAAWTHETHVRVGWLHLQRDPFAQALRKMGAGIRRLNEVHGVANSTSSGYHETLTVTFMSVIWAAVQAAGAGATSAEFCAANPHLLAKTLPHVFYTRARLASAEARLRFVAPDLAALPTPPGWHSAQDGA